jgi:hypothetical protein
MSEKPTAKTTQRSRAPTKGLRLYYVELAAVASVPRGGSGGSDGARWGEAASLGAGSRHADRRTRRSSTRGQPGLATPRGCRANPRRSLVRFSLALSLAPLGPEEGTRPGATVAVLIRGGFAAPERGRRHNHFHRRASHPSSSTQSRRAARRCRGTRHRSGTPSFVRHVPDQPPGLAPQVLVERIRMPELRRDGLAPLRPAGA